MIERWFPCAEVSEASTSGWGSGKSEKALFTWFAARPLAQAKAAVITSLLPWPSDAGEQARLKDLVRRALTDRDAAHDELVAELAKHYPEGASLLDPFSGRAMIPLEAARLGVKAWGIDYSPVATLAGTLLADYPLRDWSAEPPLPFGNAERLVEDRLVSDVKRVLDEVGRRYEAAMAEFYPKHEGRQPWGYLWAVTLPCQECGRRFPVTGSLVLRHPLPKKGDAGQSYRIEVDKAAGTFWAVVHDGPPTGLGTLVTLKRGDKNVRGKVAVCPFCEHVHPKDVHTRLAAEGHGRDALLVAADLDDAVGKRFRTPTDEERAAVEAAAAALGREAPFGPDLPAVPHEPIPPGNGDTVRPSMYGAKTYGDFCNVRQTLGFVRLARIIATIGEELMGAGASGDYAAALCGYAASVIVRKIKYSTRGAQIRPYKPSASRPDQNWIQVDHVFKNEASIAFSYDYFEAGLGNGPGTWPSLCDDTISVLRNQASRAKGCPAQIQRGSALSLPLPPASLTAVVTDPPYDNMIDYSDASDLFYAWLKRALVTTHPDFAITADPRGVQEKTEEIIVKRGGAAVGDHRTADHYDSLIAKAFKEAQRVVRADGIVTIVFGHGEPEVWHRLLNAITKARLFLTGSWAAKTEVGGGAGSANIVTTLTLACRPAPARRPTGRVNVVDDEVRQEVFARVPQWTADGLALTDQLMASAGPAMEIVGRYEQVLDRKGDPVDPVRYLYLARKAVEEAAAINVDELPLNAFDQRTRFALFWAQLFGRGAAPKSEARWQALASDLSLASLDGQVLVETDKGEGVRLAFAREVQPAISASAATIDVAFAVAKSWNEGFEAAADVLVAAGRDGEDSHLWAALTFLCSRLPEGDPDRLAWTALVRARRNLAGRARDVVVARKREAEKEDARARQMDLFKNGTGRTS
jgi:adenine-specific DNA methylase